MLIHRAARLGLLAILGAGALLFAADAPAPAPASDHMLAYVSTDKPIYRIGEKVYLRAVLLGADDHKPAASGQMYYSTLTITGPKGDTITTANNVQVQDSTAGYAWDVPPDVAGGEYKATFSFPNNGYPAATRKFDVRAYRAPRIKGEIIFVRDGYGAGDTVKATMHVDRAEGGVPAGATVSANAIVDGQDVWTGSTTVDALGNCAVQFPLPKQIEKGEGTLSLSVNDSGTVEAIAKTIPILVNTVDIAVYPEGGELIAGTNCRVYVEGRTPAQKPADLAGWIVDSKGKQIVAIKTEHEGRGRVEFTPVAREKYSIKLSEPAGIDKLFPLPAVKLDGVSIVSDQDTAAPGEAIKMHIASPSGGQMKVTLKKHETVVATTTIDVPSDKPAAIALTPPDWADGVMVATVWSAESNAPLAERLVFRQPKTNLVVKVTADKAQYTPGDSASVTVTTTDAAGKPVAATVGITVSDDSIPKMLEQRDRPPRLDAMVLLESDVKELEDAQVYFDPTNPKASQDIDLLLGTQGWRRFATLDETQFLTTYKDQGRRALATLTPPVRSVVTRGIAVGGAGGGGRGGRGGAAFGAAPGGAMVMNGAAAAGAPVPAPMVREAVPANNPQVDAQLQAKLAAQPALPGPAAAMPPPAAPMPPAGIPAGAGADAAAVAGPMIPAGGAGRGRGGGGGGLGGMAMAARPIMPPVRIYAHDLSPNRDPSQRTDFTETLYWAAAVNTDATTGSATISFHLNDSVTTFKATADAFNGDGTLGTGSAMVTSIQPFYVEPKIPLEVSAGDKIRLPIETVNQSGEDLKNVKLSVFASEGIQAGTIDPFDIAAGARDRHLVDLTVGDMPKESKIKVSAEATNMSDDVTRTVTVKPLGFPMEVANGGMMNPNSDIANTITIPDSVNKGSIRTNVVLYVTPMGNLTQALEGLMQEPNGCFEQTTSTNYPLVMADQYFLTHSGVDPQLIAKSNVLMAKGYARLISYQCPTKGFEWFGEDPGHECLSAYGLLEFTDMSQVMAGVDQTMLQNTRDWLMAHRDGQGGFTHERRALHTWITDPDCANGYCTWALLECGQKGLDKEVAWVKTHAGSDPNSYALALAANVMDLSGDKATAKTFMDRLAAKQDKTGLVAGATTSVVGSSGESLNVETTALATLAWLRQDSYAAQAEKAINYLAESCKGGRYGSTQSTVLALRAIVTYDKLRSHPTMPGKAQILVDNQPVGDAIAFDASTQGAIKLADFSGKLLPGKHVVDVKMTDGNQMPYALTVDYNSITPASASDCKLTLQTSLKDKTVAEGAVSEVDVTVSNLSKDIVPTPIAIIGLPGGLEPRVDQLKELVKAGTIAAYEIRGREVILYWRDLDGSSSVKVPLSVVAAVPGTYTGPASRAYLYYSDEFKQWQAGMQVTITPKG
jgi:uncharacterized protein YfaS (alpha-2-macroglobulin family)